jgi:tripartite-type tricarboxylate transporter receptor subunit TctC
MGVLAPAATPPAIVARLNRDIAAVLSAPGVKAALIAQGLEPGASTPAAFARRIRRDIAKWRTVVATAGVRAD